MKLNRCITHRLRHTAQRALHRVANIVARTIRRVVRWTLKSIMTSLDVAANHSAPALIGGGTIAGVVAGSVTGLDAWHRYGRAAGIVTWIATAGSLAVVGMLVGAIIFSGLSTRWPGKLTDEEPRLKRRQQSTLAMTYKGGSPPGTS